MPQASLLFQSGLWPIHGMYWRLMTMFKNPATHLTKTLQAHYPYLNIINVVFISKMMIQSGYNFAHATTAQLSWHVQNRDLIGSLEIKLRQKYFHKISVISS